MGWGGWGGGPKQNETFVWICFCLSLPSSSARTCSLRIPLAQRSWPRWLQGLGSVPSRSLCLLSPLGQRERNLNQQKNIKKKTKQKKTTSCPSTFKGNFKWICMDMFAALFHTKWNQNFNQFLFFPFFFTLFFPFSSPHRSRKLSFPGNFMNTYQDL